MSSVLEGRAANQPLGETTLLSLAKAQGAPKKRKESARSKFRCPELFQHNALIFKRASDGIRTRDLSITNRLHYLCATLAIEGRVKQNVKTLAAQ